MSGDLGAEVVVRAAYSSLEQHSDLKLALVGDEKILQELVTRIVGRDNRLTIHHASEVVGMSESPVDALRKKKNSSMRVAIDMVKDGIADACVSAGKLPIVAKLPISPMSCYVIRWHKASDAGPDFDCGMMCAI
jgi:glycerol-3-phosphate acyltransferase PlsX